MIVAEDKKSEAATIINNYNENQSMYTSMSNHKTLNKKT